ncbi:MAG: hypothetical protein AB7V23_14890 [Candidatus Nanopelagicales bacterium]
MTSVGTQGVVVAAYGAGVQTGMTRATDAVDAGRHGEALEAARPTVERALFRLAGLALSRWVADGMPNAAAWPLRSGPLSMGDAVALLGFCTGEGPLLPSGRLAAPATGRLQAVVEHTAAALAALDPGRARSPRLDLRELVAGAPAASRRGTKLGAAFEHGFVRLRNLEAHHAGRAQPWVGEHPDYAEVFAPLVIEAGRETLGHPEIVAALDGLCVAEVVDVSPQGRERTPLITLTPDATGLQRAFCRDAPGLGALEPGQEVVIQVGTDPSRARAVMRFVDVAQGPPRHPVTGAPLP